MHQQFKQYYYPSKQTEQKIRIITIMVQQNTKEKSLTLAERLVMRIFFGLTNPAKDCIKVFFSILLKMTASKVFLSFFSIESKPYSAHDLFNFEIDICFIRIFNEINIYYVLLKNSSNVRNTSVKGRMELIPNKMPNRITHKLISIK